MRDEIIKALARGAAKKAINQRNFKQYKVPCPAYPVQLKIMDKVNKLNVDIKSKESEKEELQNSINTLKEKIKDLIL